MKRTAIPRPVIDDPNALEVATVWSAGGRLLVSLNLSVSVRQPDGELDKLGSWGFLLGDMVHHVANALSQETGYPRDFVLQELKQKIVRELEDPSHTVTGDVSGNRHDTGA